MAISMFGRNPEAEMARIWHEMEVGITAMARAGEPAEYIHEQRRRAWEDLQRHMEDKERYPQQPPMKMPEPPKDVVLHIAENERLKKIEAAMLQAKQEKRKRHMESAAMLCSITDGINLWIARWGDGWVSEEEIKKASDGIDTFNWGVLQGRLQRVSRMEVDNDFVRVVT